MLHGRNLAIDRSAMRTHRWFLVSALHVGCVGSIDSALDVRAFDESQTSSYVKGHAVLRFGAGMIQADDRCPAL